MKNKILIVDDDIDSLTIQQSITQRLGYYTQIAINGLDAIKFIKQDSPDIILLDIFMPEMDGYETIKYIQKNYMFHNLLNQFSVLMFHNIFQFSNFHIFHKYRFVLVTLFY